MLAWLGVVGRPQSCTTRMMRLPTSCVSSLPFLCPLPLSPSPLPSSSVFQVWICIDMEPLDLDPATPTTAGSGEPEDPKEPNATVSTHLAPPIFCLFCFVLFLFLLLCYFICFHFVFVLCLIKRRKLQLGSQGFPFFKSSSVSSHYIASTTLPLLRFLLFVIFFSSLFYLISIRYSDHVQKCVGARPRAGGLLRRLPHGIHRSSRHCHSYPGTSPLLLSSSPSLFFPPCIFSYL